MDSDLAARLTAHENAFEGLLNLIPAKFYNPEAASDPTGRDQWNKRKQSTEEKSAAKRAKLTPKEFEEKSAQTNSDEFKSSDKNVKKSKRSEQEPSEKAKKLTKAARKALQKARLEETSVGIPASETAQIANNPSKKSKTKLQSPVYTESSSAAAAANEELDETPVVTPTKVDFSMTSAEPPRNISELRAKLAAKIESLRSRRKAPGSNAEGAPKSRDAILEARRIKEEARAARKKAEKEARKEAQFEEEPESDSDEMKNEDDEEEEADEQGDEDQGIEGISYGKIKFGTGESLNAALSLEQQKKRKQQDPKSALLAAIAKKDRLSALDEEKRSKITESDAWHKALLQSSGQKQKDDISLLKKAVKRKETQKKKSEKEWGERLASIKKAKAMKQKSREQNLKDRRESKGKKGGHKVKKAPYKGKGGPGKDKRGPSKDKFGGKSQKGF